MDNLKTVRNSKIIMDELKKYRQIYYPILKEVEERTAPYYKSETALILIAQSLIKSEDIEISKEGARIHELLKENGYLN